MPKWIDEKVLQRYWKDRCKNYEINGKKLKSARFNQPFDQYPDVFNELEDGSEVPAEVEWKTSDFDHDIEVLRENNGFLIVYQKNQNFSLPQVIIDHEDFKKWFRNKSTTILTESLREYSKEKAKREFPKIWLRYNDIKNNENMETSLKIGYDGFPEKTKTLPRVKDVKKNDLVLFIGPYKSSQPGRGGRVVFKDFRGHMKRVILMKVTKDYNYDPKDRGWKSRVGEKFPHLFGISKPLLEFIDLKLDRLSDATRHTLHHLLATGFWEADPTHFVELLSRAHLLKSHIVAPQ